MRRQSHMDPEMADCVAFEVARKMMLARFAAAIRHRTFRRDEADEEIAATISAMTQIAVMLSGDR